jgi:hypothetical protein
MFLVSSVAFAKPSQNINFGVLNKADSQFLFDGTAKV